jgi:predicted ATP-grasp superfamily ATP-dependent carboligase
MGVPVYVADLDARAPACVSRFCREVFPCRLDDPETAVRTLLAASRRIGRPPILVPTTDDAVIFVASHRAALGTGYLGVDIDLELVRGLCSKKRMHFLARQCGVPTAHAVFPERREDVLRFLEDAVFPVMLKGIDGLRLWRERGERMLIVHSREELLAAYDRLEDPHDPNLMLQEYIPGGDDTVWMFNGYFNARSECLMGMTGKKIRQYPVHRGATTLGICLRNEEVAHTTMAFMRAIGYRGVLDMGYRFDARDGQYKVLDVNPRVGATFRLFVSDSGMDVVRAMYLDATGQSVHPGTAREGRRWIVEDLDLASSLRYRRERTLTVGAWLRSLRDVQEVAYFARDDLRPLLAMGLRRVQKLVRHIAATARRRLGEAAVRRRPATGATLRPVGRREERLRAELDPSVG